MSTSLKKPKWLARGALALVAGAAFLALTPMPGRAMGPGDQALFGSYETNPSGILTSSAGALFDGSISSDPTDPETGTGDAILRIENPVGNANFSLGPVVNECAMIYVFDDDEEMGACCGCPITPVGLLTFSFQANLLSNWGSAFSPTGDGMIAIQSAPINNAKCTSFGFPDKTSPACNGGCDPSTGYNVNGPLFGSITQAEQIGTAGPSNVVELPLFNNSSAANPEGDLANHAYLIEQCTALVGNGSGTGICNCPTGSSSGLSN